MPLFTKSLFQSRDCKERSAHRSNRTATVRERVSAFIVDELAVILN